MRFQEVGGQDLLIFKPDEAGQMQMIITYPFMVFKRVGLWENSGILLPVFGLSLLVMLLALVLWPIGWYVRRRHDHRLDLTGREWLLRLAVRADFAFYIIFIVFIAGLLIHAMSNYEFLSGSSVVWFRFAQVFGVIAVIGSIVVFYNAVHAWMSSRYRIWGKLQATVFALATLGLLWFIFAGNLLSFSSRF